jgi:hypothetical protein
MVDAPPHDVAAVQHTLRRTVLLLAIAACGGDPAPAVTPPPRVRPAPVGLFGTWVQAPGQVHRIDTLILGADSAARGFHRDALDSVWTVSNWTIRFRSRDAVESRSDLIGGGFQDGGDASCTFDADTNCVSAPVLCLGDSMRKNCVAFRWRGDSLSLQNGARYARARPSP